MSNDLRILMIHSVPNVSAKMFIWASNQIDSLKALGLEVETYSFSDLRSLKGLLRGGIDLRQKVKEFEPDLIHVHYGAAQALVTVLFLTQPVVVSFCGSDLLGNYDKNGRKTWSGRLSTLLSRFAALGADRCIAKTEELKSMLWTRSSRGKCDVIPNGVDPCRFKPMSRYEARATLGWTHNDPVVLFIDRKGAWVKDPALAQAAYEEAKKATPSLRMHIVEGEPPEMMPFYFNAANVLLLTSRHEGSNNTVKEAMACDLPIVATACGDILERLHGVSLSYACSREPRELGARLTEVIMKGERSNGREHVMTLAHDRVASQVKQCYEKILN